MPRMIGKELVVKLYSGGSWYTLSGHQTEANFGMAVQSADMTAADDDYSSKEPTFQELTASMTTIYRGEDDSATWGALPNGSKGTVVIYPKGSSSGYPMAGFPCFLSKEWSLPHNDKITRSVTFEPIEGGVYGTNIFDPDVHTC